MKTLIDKLEEALAPSKDYKYSAGADVADSIALMVMIALICLVVF